MASSVNIGLIAGEASGDLLGAGLLNALRKLFPHFEASGIGGPFLQAENFQALYPSEKLSVMGLIEPLKHLPELLRIRRGILSHFLQSRPQAFIGIDSPDFNLGVELKLKQSGISTIHYVSPSVWAWRQKRIFKIAKATDLVLTLLPFEAAFYQKHHVPARFVGHPLADAIPLENNKEAARKRLGLNSKAIFIAVLPGSRRNELKYLADTFIRTAKACFKARPEIQFITCAANPLRDAQFKSRVTEIAPELPMHFFLNQSADVLAAADVVLVTSGTATLEAMLHKKPMVIAYRMAGLSYQLAKWLVKTQYIGLPNLLSNELLVPEYIQHQANPDTLSQALLHFLDNPQKMEHISDKFVEIHSQLRCNANQKAAEAVANFCR